MQTMACRSCQQWLTEISSLVAALSRQRERLCLLTDCVLQQRHGISTGTASSESPSRRATQDPNVHPRVVSRPEHCSLSHRPLPCKVPSPRAMPARSVHGRTLIRDQPCEPRSLPGMLIETTTNWQHSMLPTAIATVPTTTRHKQSMWPVCFLVNTPCDRFVFLSTLHVAGLCVCQHSM